VGDGGGELASCLKSSATELSSNFIQV
jgi:hypothetical protein